MTTSKPSTYLNYLPAIFHDDPFVGQFLLAFERILAGKTSGTAGGLPEQPGLETYVDNLYTYFRPQETPSGFLPWLSGWVALSLRDDWSEDFKREFIANMVTIYRQRGTKAGLKTLLEMYTGEKATIYEFDDPPHYFQVEMTLADVNDLAGKRAIAEALIDQEKPAHTYYSLRFMVPMMQLTDTYVWPEGATQDEGWEFSKVSGLRLGWNTILGNTQVDG